MHRQPVSARSLSHASKPIALSQAVLTTAAVDRRHARAHVSRHVSCLRGPNGATPAPHYCRHTVATLLHSAARRLSRTGSAAARGRDLFRQLGCQDMKGLLVTDRGLALHIRRLAQDLDVTPCVCATDTTLLIGTTQVLVPDYAFLPLAPAPGVAAVRE